MKISIEALEAAGVPAETILAAIKLDEAITAPAIREANRLRQQRHRSQVSHPSRDVTSVTRDTSDKQYQQLGADVPIDSLSKKDTLLEGKEERVSPRKEGKRSKRLGVVTYSSESHFLRFWEGRPRRLGPDHRAPCAKEFDELVKAGEDPEVIISGGIAAAESARADGTFGTPYVMRTIRFLKEKGYRDYAEKQTGLITLEEFRAQWANREAAKHENSTGANGAVQNIQAGRLEIHPGRAEDDRNGPLFCDQARNAGVGRVEDLLSKTVQAASMGNDRRFKG